MAQPFELRILLQTDWSGCGDPAFIEIATMKNLFYNRATAENSLLLNASRKGAT